MAKITSSPTPNPNSLKFTIKKGTFIESGMETFDSPEDAADHELGRRLFALAGVANIFILPEFLTVTKDPGADWDELVPKIEAVVSNYLDGS